MDEASSLGRFRYKLNSLRWGFPIDKYDSIDSIENPSVRVQEPRPEIGTTDIHQHFDAIGGFSASHHQATHFPG